MLFYVTIKVCSKKFLLYFQQSDQYYHKNTHFLEITRNEHKNVKVVFMIRKK